MTSIHGRVNTMYCVTNTENVFVVLGVATNTGEEWDRLTWFNALIQTVHQGP